MLHYIDQANQEDMIEIKIFNKPFEFIKKHIAYEIQDKTLIIDDKFKNEMHLLNINSIKAIRIIAPKKIGITWFKNETQQNREVKVKMSS